MSKYNSFEDFMQSVINEADRKCRSRYGKSLTEAFGVAANTSTIVKAIIEKGWWSPSLAVTMLAVGRIRALYKNQILAASGIRALYKNRVLPIVVKEVGEYYKSEFNNHRNEPSYIDSLINRASDKLLNRAIGR